MTPEDTAATAEDQAPAGTPDSAPSETEMAAEQVAADRTEHDPFAPLESRDSEAFPADRWRRAGASDEDVASLEEHFDTLEPGNRAAQVNAMNRASDGELRQSLDAQRESGEWAGFTPAAAPELPEQQGPTAARNPVQTAGPVDPMDPAAAAAGAPGPAEQAPAAEQPTGPGDAPQAAGEAPQAAAGADADDHDAAKAEAEAGGGTETEPVHVDGQQFRAFSLSNGWLSALVGDVEKGIEEAHVVAKDLPALEQAVRQFLADLGGGKKPAAPPA